MNIDLLPAAVLKNLLSLSRINESGDEVWPRSVCFHSERSLSLVEQQRKKGSSSLVIFLALLFVVHFCTLNTKKCSEVVFFFVKPIALGAVSYLNDYFISVSLLLFSPTAGDFYVFRKVSICGCATDQTMP